MLGKLARKPWKKLRRVIVSGVMRLSAVLATAMLVVGCVSSGCSVPRDSAWYVDSVKDGVVTVRHLNLVYKASSASYLPEYRHEALVAASDLVGKRIPDRGSRAQNALHRGEEDGMFVDGSILWFWSRKGATASGLQVTSVEVVR